jgi:hypothetical protein
MCDQDFPSLATRQFFLARFEQPAVQARAHCRRFPWNGIHAGAASLRLSSCCGARTVSQGKCDVVPKCSGATMPTFRVVL